MRMPHVWLSIRWRTDNLKKGDYERCSHYGDERNGGSGCRGTGNFEGANSRETCCSAFTWDISGSGASYHRAFVVIVDLAGRCSGRACGVLDVRLL